ncbi:hypothetical protein Patl1_28093 [Pistacia atlantica]|uniref:Uncharacterized protein n=1 Tax=Pistacia atlantica TaxID=434234 RepID=A0ACC1BDM9_9ROSI|nr:hypothetical protein Patl1_28093 [Pistacia atlantica]
MDLADVQADLQALRKLYSLLQISSNEILDERAKLFLKNLLDGATEKALERSSKIIAAAESDFSKAQKFSIVPNCSAFTSRKAELSPNKRTPETVVSGSSRFDKISNRKKRCGFCEGRSMKQQWKPGIVAAHGVKRNYRYVKKQGKESVKNNLTPSGKMIKETQMNPSDAKPILELEKKSGNASMDVSNTVRWIESAISSSKSFSHPNVECVKNGQSKKSNSSANHIIANSQQVSQRTWNNVNSSPQVSQRTWNNVNSSPQVSQRTSNNVNSTRQPDQIVRKNVERKELLRPSASRNDHLAEEPLKLQKRKEDKTSSVKSISSIIWPTLLGADRDSNINQMRRHMDEGSSADGSESVDTATSSSVSTQKTCLSTNNDSDNKAKSLLHRRFADVGNKSSSSSEESSSASPTRMYRFDHHSNPEAGIGRLRRLKNKFRFIFHHHHHHHHHHHKYKDYDSDDNGHCKVHYINPKRKHLPNVFHDENKKEVYGKQGFEKLGKSKAIMMPNKGKGNYFHTIMKGLRTHVRDSKKSKAGRGRNSVNKLHWWQQFKRNGGVRVKLGKKGRMRLGVKSKKLR